MNFGLSGHHNFDVDPFRVERFQRRLRLRLHHLKCINMAAFQLHLQSGKQRKVGWVGDNSHVAFGQIFPGEKGVVVIQQQVLLSPKFRAKYSHICTQSPYNVTVVRRIDLLACQDKFFVTNHLDVK
jgi:hypothetical protein